METGVDFNARWLPNIEARIRADNNTAKIHADEPGWSFVNSYCFHMSPAAAAVYFAAKGYKVKMRL